MIRFRHDQRVFTIDFALLSYARSDLDKYAYTIDGIDRNRNYVQNPSVTYTSLPSGTYTLQIKAGNSDGFDLKDALRLKIIILPSWWRTWWAYLLYLILTALVLYAITCFF